MSNIKLDWNDITIVPETISSISSRSEINPFNGDKLPLFASPMDTVIDEKNYTNFLDLGINVCLPRHIKYTDLKDDRVFYSYGLDEVIAILDDNGELPSKVLIDVANGHMLKLLETSKRIKTSYNVELMVGNIANPETYRSYCEAGVDWIRVGIGGGCFTPDSLIETKSGLKKISDIKVGDQVKTHNNRFKSVTQKHKFEKSEKLIRINDIECTKNHEFYVIFKSDKEFINEENIKDYAFWIESSKLEKELHLLVKF